jgi:hypothetical protein
VSLSHSTIPLRYEAKYHLSVEQAEALKHALPPWCVPDPMSGDTGYELSSLYLDGPQLPLYHHTRQQRARRYKLRIRRYQNNAYFAEVKSRVKSMIVKTRIALQEDEWPSLWLNPSPDQEIRFNSRLKTDWNTFVMLGLKAQARPTVVVRYRRQAWVSEIDEYARITFDSELKATPALDGSVPLFDQEAIPYGGWHPFDLGQRFSQGRSGVVLELKSEKKVPFWMQDLVHQFGLKWQGFSKYCGALEQIYPHRFQSISDQLSDRRSSSNLWIPKQENL